MEQINEAYDFIKGVFRDNAEEILRKVYVLPKSATESATTETKPVKAKKASGWIAHPCPRNIVKLTADKTA
jgi:hypothetical protein